MPLTVPCTGCPTKLSAPESAAGKQIRCPKCKAVVTVPALVAAEEVPVVEAKVAPPPAPAPAPKSKTDTTIVCCIVCNTMIAVLAKVKVVHCPKCGFANPAPGRLFEGDEGDEDERPRKKRSRRDEAEDADDERPRKKKRRPVYDDDEDEEDERPRRRKRKPVGSGSGGGRVIFMVCGLLLLFGLCGGGAYFLIGKGGGVFAKKTPVPPGWKEYSYPNDGFKAYFPSAPEALVNQNNPMRFGPAPVGAGFGGAPEFVEVESVSVYTCGDALFGGQPGGVSVTITVQKFRNGVPRSLRDNVGKISNAKFGNMQSRRIRWLGYDAGELVLGNTVMRVVYTDNAQITVQLAGPNGTRATPEVENGFFDNFQLTK